MQRRHFLTFALSTLGSYAFADEIKIADMLEKFLDASTIKPSAFLSVQELLVLERTRQRLNRVRADIGHGRFNIISYDEMLRRARNYSSIGTFENDELALMERLFYENTNEYGFFGMRTCESLSTKINEKELKRFARSGHFLFKGEALEAWEKIRKDVGKEIVLTSGVRGVAKQMSLFVNKIAFLDGRIEEAAKAIAPPGHSYHSIGDFDVGQAGFGDGNFSAEFAKTRVFKKLVELGYVKIRYTQGNADGVQYEPWHIEIVGKHS